MGHLGNPAHRRAQRGRRQKGPAGSHAAGHGTQIGWKRLNQRRFPVRLYPFFVTRRRMHLRPGTETPEQAMARVCVVTGKAPMVGNNVSHANNRTRRRFMPNLQRRKFWVESENRWVSLRLTNAALRTIDKKGIDVILAELRSRGEHV